MEIRIPEKKLPLESKDVGQLSDEKLIKVTELYEKSQTWKTLLNSPVNCENFLTPTTVFRFLEGEVWCLKKAENKLKKCLEWRKETLEDIKICDFDELRSSSFVPISYVCGVDLTGHPVLYLDVGNALLFPDCDKGARKFRHMCCTIETLYSEMPKDKHRFSVVVDCKNAGLGIIPTILRIGTKFQSLHSFYPDTLHCAYVVNSPFLIKKLWGICKIFLDPVTAEKFVFLDKCEELKKYIGEDQLCCRYGGKNKKNDEKYI